MSDVGDRFEETESFSLNKFIDKYEMFIYTPIVVVFNVFLFALMSGLVSSFIFAAEVRIFNILRIIPYMSYFLLNFVFLQYFFSILNRYGSLKTLLYLLSFSTVGIPICIALSPISAVILFVRVVHRYLL